MKKVFIYFSDQIGSGWFEAFDFDVLFLNDSKTEFYKNGELVGSIPHSKAFKIEKQ